MVLVRMRLTSVWKLVIGWLPIDLTVLLGCSLVVVVGCLVTILLIAVGVIGVWVWTLTVVSVLCLLRRWGRLEMVRCVACRLLLGLWILMLMLLWVSVIPISVTAVLS